MHRVIRILDAKGAVLAEEPARCGHARFPVRSGADNLQLARLHLHTPGGVRGQIGFVECGFFTEFEFIAPGHPVPL